MSQLKGILLAGGRGTRLYPMTSVLSKQLQPIYNKPMVYYSLTTLIVAGIRDVLVISTPEDLPNFKTLFGDGRPWGLKLSYAEQAVPRGIAEALIIGRDFIGDDSVMLMLGDNLIYGRLDFLRKAVSANGNDATVFGYPVRNPTDYGVVEFDVDGRVLSLEEKPAVPRSNWAVPGMYIYGPGVSERVRMLEPSSRGELEITDLNRQYLKEGRLRAIKMGRGLAWFDTGTPNSLLDASNFVHALETRQGLIVGSPEEAALRAGFCTLEAFNQGIASLPESPYRDYLQGIVDDLHRFPSEYPAALRQQ